MTFSVIDKRTGKAPIFDHNHIFKEKWFKNSGLIYCDIDGWYIGENGELVLIDDCGNAGYPPIDRFEVVFDEETKHGEWISLEKTRCKGQLLPFWRTHECSVCSSTGQGDFNFCPKCGADMRKEGDEE